MENCWPQVRILSDSRRNTNKLLTDIPSVDWKTFCWKGPPVQSHPEMLKHCWTVLGATTSSMLHARWCYWSTQMDCCICNSGSDYWGITFLDHVIEWQSFSTVGAFQSTCFYVLFELGHKQLWVEMQKIWGKKNTQWWYKNIPQNVYFWLGCKCWFFNERKYEKLK